MPEASLSKSAPKSSQGSELPKHGAPAVENPLNFSGIKADACSALTQSQMDAFIGQLDHKKPFVTDSKSPSCGWVFNDPATGYQISDLLGSVNLEDNASGLSTIYAHHEQGTLTTFKPIEPIGGYPAVIYSSDTEREGKCVLAVGLSNKVSYTASASTFEAHPKSKTPCAIAKKFAGFVVQTLKAG